MRQLVPNAGITGVPELKGKGCLRLSYAGAARGS